jgi:hypothetical protein
MPTYIRFGDDHSVAVQETPEELRQVIAALDPAQVPLFEATRIDGAKMLVNATGVWTITEGRKKNGRKG